MKLKNYFFGMLMAVALAACSYDNPGENGFESPELGEGENFISVSIEMPASTGSRTTTEDGLFNDGTANESEVSNIVFFFFDEAGNCIEVQKIDNPVFKDPAEPSINPNITNYGTVEIKLKAGLKYSKVAVALNSPAQNATVLKAEIASISDFLARTYKYAEYVTKTDDTNFGKGQVMSNSIYYDMRNSEGKADGTITPVENKKVDVIAITEKNIYTSAQRTNIDKLIEEGTKEYVDIYVERVLSKVSVSEATFDMEDYYVIEEGEKKKKSITIYNHLVGSSEEITVQPVIMGMCLNVLAPKTALVKPLLIEEVGYQKGDGQYKAFQWNDPENKRSYWASTALSDESAMIYYSWNEAAARGSDAFTDYIHPNTQDYKPIQANEGSSLNTKVMVVAKLCEVKEDVVDEDNPLDLVMFGADYMLSSAFLPYVASLVNRDIRNIDWDAVDLSLEDATLTTDQMAVLKAAVNDAFSNTNGYKATDLGLSIAETTDAKKFGDEDWIAKVSFTNGIVMPAIPQLAEGGSLYGVNGLHSKVTKIIADTRDATMTRVNENRILYWKGGCTYFYTNIRHQGFTGLVGTGTSDFLYGVVRNHWYNITLNGVYGLGTPVIDPAKPINPDRPNDDRPSYIKARINILPWRVVTYNATIH